MQNSFNRHELKYVVDTQLHNLIQEDIKKYLLLDNFCKNGTAYKVVSVYYDTDDYKSYWEKIESISYRKKIRLRLYGNTNFTNAFIEIKKKYKNTVNKERTNINNKLNLNSFSKNDIEISKFYTDSEVGRELEQTNEFSNLKPVIGLQYWRKAYTKNKNNNDLRITFDYDLKYNHDFNSTSLKNDFDKQFLPPNKIIMEIKINEFVPKWLLNILHKYDLIQRSYSKYCSAIATNKNIW